MKNLLIILLLLPGLLLADNNYAKSESYKVLLKECNLDFKKFIRGDFNYVRSREDLTLETIFNHGLIILKEFHKADAPEFENFYEKCFHFKNDKLNFTMLQRMKSNELFAKYKKVHPFIIKWFFKDTLTSQELPLVIDYLAQWKDENHPYLPKLLKYHSEAQYQRLNGACEIIGLTAKPEDKEAVLLLRKLSQETHFENYVDNAYRGLARVLGKPKQFSMAAMAKDLELFQSAEYGMSFFQEALATEKLNETNYQTLVKVAYSDKMCTAARVEALHVLYTKDVWTLPIIKLYQKLSMATKTYNLYGSIRVQNTNFPQYSYLYGERFTDLRHPFRKIRPRNEKIEKFLLEQMLQRNSALALDFFHYNPKAALAHLPALKAYLIKSLGQKSLDQVKVAQILEIFRLLGSSATTQVGDLVWSLSANNCPYYKDSYDAYVIRPLAILTAVFMKIKNDGRLTKRMIETLSISKANNLRVICTAVYASRTLNQGEKILPYIPKLFKERPLHAGLLFEGKVNLNVALHRSVLVDYPKAYKMNVLEEHLASIMLHRERSVVKKLIPGLKAQFAELKKRDRESDPSELIKLYTALEKLLPVLANEK